MHDLTAHPQPPTGYVVDAENVAEMARYNLLVTQAMRQQGQCFAPLGEQYGIAAVHQHLFQQAGFQQVQQEAFIIDYSAGRAAHLPMVENFQTFLKLMQPLLVRSGLSTQEDIDVLYAQLVAEMHAEDFCAAAFFQRVWGYKPA